MGTTRKVRCAGIWALVTVMLATMIAAASLPAAAEAESATPIATGIVTDVATAEPIEGAWVVAEWFNGAEYEWAGTAQTGEGGIYLLQDLQGNGAGAYQLHAEHLDGAYYPSALVDEVWDGETALEIDFVLERWPHIITGRVTDAATGEPIRDALVQASWYDAGLGEYQWAGSTHPDENGDYTVFDWWGRGPGDYEFHAEAAGYPSAQQYGSWDGETGLHIDFALGELEPEPTDPDPDPDPDSDTFTTTKIAGSGRYETAVKASKEAYPGGAGTVVVATGRNWPDALGGSALAGALDAPILLVNTNTVPEVVLAEVSRLKAVRAVIVGGEGAVGAGVANAFQVAGLTVERIAGGNRYETANAVALRTIAELGGAFDGTAFVATGGAYADAVAAGPLAASQGWPLFLAHPQGGIRSDTRAAMSAVTDVLILGGTAAVSTDVGNALQSSFKVTRLAGASRYETAVKIAEHGVAKTDLGWNGVGIATGQAYPDALAGGVLQGKKGSVMLLTRGTALSPEPARALVDNRDAITSVTFFGGDEAVLPAVRSAVEQAVKLGTDMPSVLGDGLYIDGLALKPGGSKARIVESLGTEDERYEGVEGIVNYVWPLGDGSFLTLGFTGIGSLSSGTLANLAESNVNPESTFAVLHGERVLPGETLAAIVARFPSGVMDDVISMEGFNFLSYVVRFGPEGSMQMKFSVNWSYEEELADPTALELDTITVEYW